MIQVFIAYYHENLTEAMRLYSDLKKVPNIQPWISQEDLPAGIKWKPMIRKTIRNSQYFICLLSKCLSNKVGFVHSEIKKALEIYAEFPEDQIFLIPIRIEDCDIPYEELKEINYIDFFPNWENGLKKLLKTLKIDNVLLKKEKYKFRCGIIDIDNGFTNLHDLSMKLNNIQNYFHFTCPTITMDNIAIERINDILNFNIDKMPINYYEKKQYSNVDFIIGITKYPLAFSRYGMLYSNHYSGPSKIDDRFMFISSNLLYEHCKKAGCTFEKGLIFLILGQLIVYFTDYGYHEETRGCVMDYCKKLNDRILGLKESKLCNICKSNITNTELLNAIDSILSDDIII